MRLRQAADEARQIAEAARQNYLRVKNGPRAEEIAQARANVQAAEATLNNARMRSKRLEALAETKSISRQEADDAVASRQVAAANLDVARKQLELLLAGSREEDVAQALAQAERISTLPFPYACYRVAAGGSLQSTNDRSPLCFWEAYQETKRRLEGCGLYQKYEKSFLNAVLEGTCYNLGSVKSQKSYDQICRCIREGWERDFHFSSHPPRYYQNSFQYRELRRIAEGKGSGKHRGLFVLLARGADCLRKNGWRYTWKRALSALGRG